MRTTFILPRVNAETYTKSAEVASVMKSIVLKPLISNGEIIDDIPKINKTLKIQEPRTLPNASCALPFIAAMTLVTSSGSDVPMAIIVNEITASLMPHCLAKVTAESRNMSPPHSNTAREIIAIDIVAQSGFFESVLFALSSYSCSALLARIVYHIYAVKAIRNINPSMRDNAKPFASNKN